MRKKKLAFISKKKSKRSIKKLVDKNKIKRQSLKVIKVNLSQKKVIKRLKKMTIKKILNYDGSKNR